MRTTFATGPVAVALILLGGWALGLMSQYAFFAAPLGVFAVVLLTLGAVMVILFFTTTGPTHEHRRNHISLLVLGALVAAAAAGGLWLELPVLTALAMLLSIAFGVLSAIRGRKLARDLGEINGFGSLGVITVLSASVGALLWVVLVSMALNHG